MSFEKFCDGPGCTVLRLMTMMVRMYCCADIGQHEGDEPCSIGQAAPMVLNLEDLAQSTPEVSSSSSSSSCRRVRYFEYQA